ncbi:MAG: hypothetical protein LBJ38_03415 [Oscillospiraceae bacterium]|nr:hypothetical protein [Oscillospiraceae bacterium]
MVASCLRTLLSLWQKDFNKSCAMLGCDKTLLLAGAIKCEQRKNINEKREAFWVGTQVICLHDGCRWLHCITAARYGKITFNKADNLPICGQIKEYCV